MAAGWSLIIVSSNALLCRRMRNKKKKRHGMDNDSDEEERLQLPVVSYFALVIGYCSLGSMLFNMWEKGAM